jgi:hypothetical protein
VLKRLLFAVALLLVPLTASANEPDRGDIIERLTKGIASTGVHRIYIPDFPDSSGQPTLSLTLLIRGPSLLNLKWMPFSSASSIQRMARNF